MTKKKVYAKRSEGYKQRKRAKLHAKRFVRYHSDDEYRDKYLERSRLRMDRAKASVSARYSHLKNSSKGRGLPVTMTKEEYHQVRDNPCFYCEGPISPTATGLDRLDNTLGYTVYNTVACCGPCNVIRGVNLTVNEMIEVAKFLKVLRKQG